VIDVGPFPGPGVAAALAAVLAAIPAALSLVNLGVFRPTPPEPMRSS
jgi:hypothetical protein